MLDRRNNLEKKSDIYKLPKWYKRYIWQLTIVAEVLILALGFYLYFILSK